MNTKSTLALVLLAAAAGVWFFMGDELAPKLGMRPTQPEPAKSEAAVALDALAPAAITAITVNFPSGDPLKLSRESADSAWKLPGNWPPRVGEVEDLVKALGSLHARFHPQALGESPDLSQFGLAPGQNPITVKLTANGKPLTLTFGEPAAAESETAFTRSAFVRVNDGPEVFRLGPDVMPVLRRQTDAYRRRQLFPDIERVKVAGAAAQPPSPFGPPPSDEPVTVTFPGNRTESITVQGPAPTVLGFELPALARFTITRTGSLPEPGVLTKGGEAVLRQDRLGDAWAITAPAADHAEPARLRSILAAIADLWVEEFVRPVPPEEKLGFDSFNRTLTVQIKGGKPLTVRFGNVARTREREEMMTVPGGPPGSPPRTIPRKITVEYRYARVEYARVEGDPQVFLISSEKFNDLFVPFSEVIDPRVARFDADEVVEVAIRGANANEGAAPLRLLRRKGNPKAEKLDDREDRWVIEAKPNDLPADEARVNELLARLAGLRADAPDRHTYPSQPLTAQTRVTVLARERRAENEPDAPTRTYQLQLGKPDLAKRLLPVALAGNPRVTLADDQLGPDPLDSWVGSLLFPDTVSAWIKRPALAYRGRKLIETGGSPISEIAVSNGFTLRNAPGGWKLTAPVASAADAEKSSKLAEALANLQVTEYLTESPTPAQLATFGLDKPKQKATLTLADGRNFTLEVGNPRPGKPEVFARLDGGAVFALASTDAEPLATGAVGLLPLSVWNIEPERVDAVKITRFGDDAKQGFTLTKDGTNWKLSGPFTAPVPFLSAQPLLATLGQLTAQKYHSLAATNPAEFGFDKPLLTVEITQANSDGKPVARKVIVGGVTPEGASRFAKLDNPNAPVFVVPEVFVTAAKTAALDLPDRSLLMLDPARIAKVQVTPGPPEAAFTLTRDAAGKWTAEGVTFAVDAGRISELLATAARLPVLRLAAYGDAIKWADFGLEKPTTTIAVTLDGEKPTTHRIALGNPDPSGARFARIDATPAVVLVPASTAETLTRKRFDYADRTLLSFDPATLTALTRTRGKEEIEIAPSAGLGWDVVKPAKHKADSAFVDELADALSRLQAERVAAYGKKDEVFKQYGLEPAAAVVTVTVGEQAQQKTLRIGNAVNATQPDGDRYVAIESPAPEVIVGVMPAALANRLLAPTVAFRDRTLTKFVDADTATFERGDRKVTFTKSGVTWKLTDPIEAPAESAELESLVADLGQLRAATWVAEKGKDLAPFGLDKPQAKWTLSYDGKPVAVLLLGSKAADGRIHATSDQSELVGLLDAAKSARVLAEFRLRKPWEVDVAQADAVEANVNGEKFAFRKDGPRWLDPAKPTDAIDPVAVTDLLGTLSGLRVERFAADKAADAKLFGLDKPETTWTVATPTGKAVLELGAVVGGSDGKQRYARIGEPSRTDVFILSAEDTAKLTRPRANYVQKK